ncbi:MAG: PAS domain S-box protein, partial [Thermodesulfobacteriota bacterium]|nr:PAS domain S-box protein [Thermodesulfobacteriota bacterium]
MKKKITFDKKSSLQAKFLLMLLPAVVVSFLIFSLLFSFFTYKEKRETLISKLDNYARSQASVLSKPLWEINLKVAKSQIESQLLASEISGISVKDFITETVLHIGLPRKRDSFDNCDNCDNCDNYFKVKKKIVYKTVDGVQKKIGQVTLFASKSQLYMPIVRTFLRETLLLFLLVIAVLCSALLVNKKIIHRPLSRLLKSIHQADREKLLKKVNWSSNDEFGEVIGAYNKLVDSLDKSEKALKKSEKRFRTMVETSKDLIWSMDINGVYTYVSPRAKALLGYDPKELIGKTMFSIMAEEMAEKMKETLKAKVRSKTSITGIENQYIHKNGKDVLLEMNGVPVLDEHGAVSGYTGIERDITQRRQMVDMMVQSGKMLSVGSLAAGMAHEINNPLAGMMQNAQVVFNRLSMNLPANDKAAREAGTTMAAIKDYMEKRNILSQLEIINESGGYAAKILQNMLSFAQESVSGRIAHDLARILDKTIELAKSDYDLKSKFDFKKIKFKKKYSHDFPVVVCDENKIQQAFLNILKNGAEAMHEENKKEPEFILRLAKDNDMARLEIEDNGPGMDEQTCK